ERRGVLTPALAGRMDAREDLIRQIAVLDEAYEAGQIARVAYEERRAALVASLNDLLNA
ncbi:MAG: hypothetical protein IT326_05925, partial [Anaerolineae bacterium]|nr:hypothetical protein [Anaerolineae bacterium]